MKDLFANDEAMRLRDSRGRFATPERAYADRVAQENKLLRLKVDRLSYEREKYFRAWMAVSDTASRVNRELAALKARIKELGASA